VWVQNRIAEGRQEWRVQVTVEVGRRGLIGFRRGALRVEGVASSVQLDGERRGGDWVQNGVTGVCGLREGFESRRRGSSQHRGRQESVSS